MKSASIAIAQVRERLVTGVDVGDIDVLERNFSKLFLYQPFDQYQLLKF